MEFRIASRFCQLFVIAIMCAIALPFAGCGADDGGGTATSPADGGGGATDAHQNVAEGGAAAGVDSGVSDAGADAASPVRSATLTIDLPTHHFGSVTSGEKSPAATFTITNAGTAASSAITASVSGADFAIDQNTCATLAPTASCTITVTFAPTTTGAATGTLSVVATNGGTVTAALDGDGVEPGGLAISASTNQLGTAIVGQTSTITATFTVTNDGDTKTAPLSLQAAGSNPGDFSVSLDDCSGRPLQPAQTCTFLVSFAPLSAGAKSASFEVSALGSVVSGAVSGNALAPAKLVLLPSEIDFGSVVIKTTSQPRTLTVANSGDVASGSLTPSVAGTAFEIVSSTCAGAPLGPKATCNVVLDFKPATVGVAAGQLTVTGTPGGTVAALLQGIGIATGQLTITPSTVELASTIVGQNSAATTFTVTNTSSVTTSALTTDVGGIDPDAFPFVAGTDTCKNARLPLGASCTIALVFSPTHRGPAIGELTIASANNGVVVAGLAGFGLSPAQLVVSPSALDFGGVATGTSSPTQTFTVTNIGSQTSTAPPVALGGVNAADFTLARNGCTATLAAAATCTIDVLFAPASSGPRAAELDVGAAKAALGGDGQSPTGLSISPSTFAFGSTLVGATSAAVDFTVRNDGTTSVDAVTLAVSGVNGSDFTETSSCTALAPADTCRVHVIFAPSASGTRTASLTATAAGGSARAALSGSATPHIEVIAIDDGPVTDPFDFGAVAINSSVVHDALVTVQNNTSADAPFSSFGTYGNPAQFATIGSTCDVSAKILAGGTCTVRLRFQPTTTGEKDGSITFQMSSLPADQVTQNLTGTGVNALTIVPVTSASFGVVTAGTTSSMQSFEVKSPVGSPTTGALATTLSGTQFAIVNDECVGTKLAGGTSCFIDVVFKPGGGGGDASADLAVTGAPGGTATITLTGNGHSAGGGPTDQPPTALALAPQSVAENVANGTKVGTFATTDPDVGDTFVYTLVAGAGGADNSAFAIGAAGDTLVTAGPIDFETKNSYAIRVRTTDHAGAFFEQSFTIAITNVDEAPTNITLSNASVPENSAAGTAVGTLVAVDPEGDPLTFTLGCATPGAGDGAFQIVGTALQTKSAALDYETQDTYAICVHVSDAGGASFDKPLTISITNVNEAPTGVSISGDGINENTAATPGAPAAVGTLSAIDPDVPKTPDTFVFSLGCTTPGANDGSFTIVGSVLKATAAFDFETQPTRTICVRIADHGGGAGTLSVDKVLTIPVKDVNEAPTNVTLAPSTIAENAGAGTAVGTLTSVDPDADKSATFTLVDPATVATCAGASATDNAAFSITTNQLKEVASFDFESGKTSYVVCVKATDAGGLTVAKPLTVGVTNTNEAPTDITLTSTSVSENALNAIVGTLGDVDPDTGDSATYTLTCATAGANDASFQITAGVLKTNGSFDYETKSSYSICVRVTDGGGLTKDKTFAISVIDQDDPPVATNDSSAATEDTQLVLGSVLSNDTDQDTNPAFQTKQITAVTQGAHGSVTFTSTSVMYSPTPDFCGTADSFTYTLNGGTVPSETATVSITGITCVNDVPSFTKGPNISGVNNQNGNGTAFAFTSPGAWATSLSRGGGADEAGQTLSFIVNVTADTTPSLFTVAPAVSATGVLTFTTNPIQAGTATVSVAIHDDGGTAGGGVDTSAAQTFTVTTLFPAPVAVADSYTATGNVALDVNTVAGSVTANDTLYGGAVSLVGPANPPTTAVGTSITTTKGATVTVAANGQFMYDPAPGYTGADSFFYVLHNGSGDSAVAQATITVSNLIWFVDNSAAAAGDGRLDHPFNTLAGFVAVNDGGTNHPAAGQSIFIASGTSAYTGSGLALLSNQKVFGQGATANLDTLAGITLAPFSLPLPTMSGTRPNLTTTAATSTVITPNGSNTLRGFDIGARTGPAIGSGGFGTLTASEIDINSGNGPALALTSGTINATFGTLSAAAGIGGVTMNVVAGTINVTSGGSLTGSTGDELLISNGSVSFTYPGTITKTGAAFAVLVSGQTGGTVSLSGAITDTTGAGSGISLTNNTGATISFGGTIQLSTGPRSAFAATGGGTVTATGSGSTLATTTGAALTVANTTIGATNLKLQSVTAGTAASGPASGIVLTNTGASGALVITGDGNTSVGGDSSGGVIQHTSGAGVQLASTSHVSLTNMNIHDTSRSGIAGTGVSGFTLASSTIERNGGQASDANVAFNSTTFTGAATLSGNNINGVLSLTNNLFTNGLSAGLDIQSDDGAITAATITNNTVTDVGAGTAAISVVGIGNGTTTFSLNSASISNNTIARANAGIQVSIGNSSAGGPSAHAGFVTFDALGRPQSDPGHLVSINGNSMTAMTTTGTSMITVANSAFASGSRTQTNFEIRNNGTPGTPIGSSSGGTVFLIGNNGFSDMAGIVDGNVIVATHAAGTTAGNGIGGGNGVSGAGSAWTPKLNLVVTNNAVSGTDGNGILLVGRGTSGEADLKIANNNVGAPLSGVRPGIRVDAGNTNSTDDAVFLDIFGNTSAGSGGVQGIGVRKQGTAATTNDFGLFDAVGGPTLPSNPSTTDVVTFIAALNPSGNGALILNGDGYVRDTTRAPP